VLKLQATQKRGQTLVSLALGSLERWTSGGPWAWAINPKISLCHRRSQDFVWGALSFPKK